jgi:hypothetical protein
MSVCDGHTVQCNTLHSLVYPLMIVFECYNTLTYVCLIHQILRTIRHCFPCMSYGLHMPFDIDGMWHWPFMTGCIDVRGVIMIHQYRRGVNIHMNMLQPWYRMFHALMHLLCQTHSALWQHILNWLGSLNRCKYHSLYHRKCVCSGMYSKLILIVTWVLYAWDIVVCQFIDHLVWAKQFTFVLFQGCVHVHVSCTNNMLNMLDMLDMLDMSLASNINHVWEALGSVVHVTYSYSHMTIIITSLLTLHLANASFINSVCDA